MLYQKTQQKNFTQKYVTKSRDPAAESYGVACGKSDHMCTAPKNIQYVFIRILLQTLFAISAFCDLIIKLL